MGRLIDADELKKHTVTVYEGSVCKLTHESIPLYYLDDIQTADAEPVRHGKWNEVQIKLFEDAPTKGFECSLCKNGWFNVDGFIFCPKCGAKMDGE